MVRKKKRRVKDILPLLLILTILPMVVLMVFTRQYYRQFAAAINTNVNFDQKLVDIDPYAFSGTISTYGADNITASAKQRTNLGSLGLGLYRIPLRWNGGNIISSAGGGPTGISGDTWINNIKAFGGTPMIVLGGSSDNNFTPAEAASMVSHFSGANKVTYWVIGNEPGNGGMSIATYCALFNSTVDAMKAVDPTIKVAGPAWAYYDTNTIQQFLNCAGSKVDIIDYHHYGMGTTFLDNATALSQTGNWETEVNQVRQMINTTVPSRASQISIQVGEYNWSWRKDNGYTGWNGDDRFYQAVTTVWGASVAGHIAKAGGRGHQYSDQNGALGITFEDTATATHFLKTVNDPLPIYHGLRMFSGGDLFRKFGTQMVQADTTLANVEIYASNNDKNIVMINKDSSAAQTASLQLNGFSGGIVDIWQTDQNAPFDAPTKKITMNIGSSFEYPLPPYSVSTFVLSQTSATVPASSPTPQGISPTLYCLGACITPDPTSAPTEQPLPTEELQPTTEPLPTEEITAQPVAPTSAIQPQPPSNKNVLQILLQLILSFFILLASLFGGK